MARESNIVQLHLEVWHPNCWAIEATEGASAGILSDVQQVGSNERICRELIYGNTMSEVETLIEKLRAAPDIHSVFEMKGPSHSDWPTSIPGNATKEVLTKKKSSATQIAEAFFSREFICSEPVRVEDGSEYWTLLTTHNREEISSSLDAIRTEKDAVIKIRRMTLTINSLGRGVLPLDRLSARQREAFELARERGYYAWPREVTPQELADELGITTSTFHEHIQKAEAKLLKIEDQ